MHRPSAAALVLALALAAPPAMAEAPKDRGQHQHHQSSPKAGQDKRALKSLSEADIAALRRGDGWGMAKAAELNGAPGPAHLLELRDRIPLTPAQVVRIRELRAEMRRQAIAAGERLIAAERALNDGFAAGSMTEARLRALLRDVAAAREALSYVHLSTHLKTPAILSAEQIARYNALRGYTR